MQQKARGLEIGTCYVTNDIDKVGMGHVIVTRKHTGGRISMVTYLVDMTCLGVKDSFYRLRMEDWEFDQFISDRRDMFHECSYEEAHNRVWGSIAYAEEAGIKPDKSFLLTQYMLEEDTDDVPLIEYEYGRDGKHFLTCRSELEASRYLPLLRQNLGEGNYNYIIGIGDPGFGEDEDYEDDYDDYDAHNTTVNGLPIDHLNMADIVGAKSTVGIEYISAKLGLGFEKIENQAEKRRQYVEYILAHPEELLTRLPKNEIDILLYIFANRDKAKGVHSANEELVLIMESACVADVYWDNEDKYCIRVADDFLRVALPLVANIRMSDAARQRYEVEAIIEGMANLYGEVTLEDAKRGVMMYKGGFRSEAGRLIDKVLEQSLVLDSIIGKVDYTKTGLFEFADDNIVFTSRYCWKEPAELRKAIAIHASEDADTEETPMPTQPFTDDEARQFTTDEFYEAGSGEMPTIPNERQKEFWHFLTRELRWEDYYARRICMELWYKANHADDPDMKDKLAIETYFEQEALLLEGLTEKERQKGRSLLADYMAHIPRWTLKGHAPAEL